MMPNFDTSTPFVLSGKITFANGNEVSLSQSDISLSGSQFFQDSGATTLPVGAVVGRILTLELINDNGQWSNKDFFGAVISLVFDYGNSNKITFSDLTVTDPPESFGTVISMTAQDNSWRLEKPFQSSIVYPTTVRLLWDEICTRCGITAKTTSHRCFNLAVKDKPSSDYTFRDIVGYVAQLGGANARITTDGKLELVNIEVPTASSSTGAHNVNRLISFSSGLHDVTVTGITMEYTDEDGASQTATAGTDGYMIQLDTNPLMAGYEALRIDTIYNYINGISLRKFELSTFHSPAFETFDGIKITDANGQIYYSMITAVTLNVAGAVDLSCPCDTPKLPASGSYDPQTRAIMTARQLVSLEKTAREQAVADLQTALANASGLYETQETQPGGGTIYYLHDKSTLAASTNIIKLTEEALGLSTDGGQTFPYGLMINGDVIARILSAEGVNADWIDTGSIIVKDPTTTEILFYADMDVGYVYIDGIVVDDGVVTVGSAGWISKLQLDEDGVKIMKNGSVTASFGSSGAVFPCKTQIAAGGSLVLGDYEVESRMDGGFTVRYCRRY